ncbi:hypothetical protein EXIGLDRAFT_841552 [Exidia glandulosa HHB12029]|uniref:DUF6535 domain-containing protein n=1 Tax=Exidia glandulosa HHB12029 TaxID=1314781 RepID=A0A165DU98_EXIGL|nr:hypothetical protein EXIGLDRAFT_841552 [Exidia glandulosa HHB12029]
MSRKRAQWYELIEGSIALRHLLEHYAEYSAYPVALSKPDRIAALRRFTNCCSEIRVPVDRVVALETLHALTWNCLPIARWIVDYGSLDRVPRIPAFSPEPAAVGPVRRDTPLDDPHDAWNRMLILIALSTLEMLITVESPTIEDGRTISPQHLRRRTGEVVQGSAPPYSGRTSHVSKEKAPATCRTHLLPSTIVLIANKAMSNGVNASERKLPFDGLDFQSKYPPDPVVGGETDADARVWKVFRDEASAYDTRMLDVWNKSLDVHLLFAGLFSAVVTAFLIESTKLLQPDTDAFVVAALFSLVEAENPDESVYFPVQDFPTGVVATESILVNALWYTSLALALAAAFVAILCKQSLSEYSLRAAIPSDNALQWARRRQLSDWRLSTWALTDVIAILPGLLHLALLLFFAGLTLSLLIINRAVGVLLCVLFAVFCTSYFTVTVASIIFDDSPFMTPMLRLLRTFIFTAILRALQSVQSAAVFVLHIAAILKGWMGLPPSNVGPESHTKVSDALRQGIAECGLRIRKAQRGTMVDNVDVQRMDATIGRNSYWLDASALDWLISVSDKNATAVAIQAVGSLAPESRTARMLSDYYGSSSLDKRLEIFKPERAASPGLSTLTSTEIVRISRSLLCAGVLSRVSLPKDMRQVLRGSEDPDARLLSGWMEDTLSALPITGTSPSFTSTFTLLLRADPGNLALLVSGLLSCDLQAIDEEKWDIIFESLCAYERLEKPLVPSDRDLVQLPTYVPRRHALSDMLRQVTERFDDFAPAAQKIIHRYLQLTAPEPLPFQPRLVRYMTSTRFLESAPEGFDSTALSRRLWLMSGSMLRVHAPYLLEMLQSILLAHRVQCDVRSIIRACTNVLTFQSAGPHVNPVAMNDRNSGGSTAPLDSAATPSDAVAHVLLPLLDVVLCDSYNCEDLAFWTLLHEGGNIWALYPEEMCALAAVLSSAICSLARTRKRTDPPIAALVAAFSCDRSCLDLLRSGVLNEVDRDNVISLVRHCAELEPDFWNDESVRTCNQPVAPETGRNGEKRQAPLGGSSCVSDILNEVMNAGPCKECRGSPIGWNNGPGGMAPSRRA